MKTISIENDIIVYYDKRVGKVIDGQAVVDPKFEGNELNEFFNKQSNIQRVKWMEGMFDQLASDSKDNCEKQALKNCRVWQLHPDADIRMKFFGYDEVCQRFGPPDPANYQLVYDGSVETNNLEALYTKFNIDHPLGYSGHSLSVSDVLELYDEFGSTFYFVDHCGFKQMDFEPTEQSIMQGPTMQF